MNDVEPLTDLCNLCGGAGEVGVRQDYFGNWETEQCLRCDGTGELTPEREPECRICQDEIVTCPECDPDHWRDAAEDR